MATKKCPNCGLENPDSAIRCQCGYSLGTGKADLEKSLAKQAQEIRKEVKKIRPSSDVQREEVSKVEVDSDVQTEVGEESRTVKMTICKYEKTMFTLSTSRVLTVACVPVV